MINKFFYYTIFLFSFANLNEFIQIYFEIYNKFWCFNIQAIYSDCFTWQTYIIFQSSAELTSDIKQWTKAMCSSSRRMLSMRKISFSIKIYPSVSPNQERHSHRPFKMRVVLGVHSGSCKLLALIKELACFPPLIRFKPLPPQVEDCICFRRPISGCHRE